MCPEIKEKDSKPTFKVRKLEETKMEGRSDTSIRQSINQDGLRVNLQLDTAANQLPYQSTLFQQLGGQKYYAKWITCGDIISYDWQRVVAR
jgi:hypothetical protein